MADEAPPSVQSRQHHVQDHQVGLSRNAATAPGGFDPARVDQTAPAGSVQEWTITNTSQMDHPFHLHVWPMQVLTVAGTAVRPATWQNVVNVPAGSSTVVRIAFDSYTGRTVFHCHILDHEHVRRGGRRQGATDDQTEEPRPRRRDRQARVAPPAAPVAGATGRSTTDAW